MKKVTKEILKKAANNILLDMSEEEYDTLLSEFDIILNQMEYIGSLPGVDELEPMTFAFDVKTDFLREDVPEEPLTREEALKNAHDISNGQIKLPKVVG
ncbi:MAG: Asp-tRNA(Asn)/Glu-tRNA(Gln) amidotransferase subunit GatC [Erysipelotrichaceae bacterium]|jgi:aspartyl-tRNA(Asn)/glutamyl-tRNA(Gln) amidotransferase subunit C|nr:Asp-tRNA(Asn)/Glu-tRNA(Gln) amidotransferase subunit GatC [Erysipelotrichaceae bacterium]